MEENPNMTDQNPDMAASNPDIAPVGPDTAPTGNSKSRKVNMEKLEAVLRRFEISIVDANDLVALMDFEMVVIADDSGSMDNPSVPLRKRVLGQACPTRWHELQGVVETIVDIASCFDHSGVDVHFLNRESVTRVKDSQDVRLSKAFEAELDGTTPLAETLQRVVEQSIGERAVLLFVLTDGEPDGGPNPFIAALKNITTGPKPVRVQIMVCSPDDWEVAWVHTMDHEIPHVDVTDDYWTEHEQVMRAGKVAEFKRSDWVMKAMLGPVSHKFDDMNFIKTGEVPEETEGRCQDGCKGCVAM